MHQIIALNPMHIPAETGVSRDERYGVDRQFPDFRDKYDFQTLFYQAVYDMDRSELILICPKLLNFEVILKEGSFSSTHGIHKIKSISKHRRHAKVTLVCANPIDLLNFTHPAFEAEVSVLQSSAILQNQSVLITRQKDNPIEWIETWAQHYVSHQKVDAIIIIDNGSDAYSVDELSKALSKIDGLKTSIVIDAPFLFGPIAKTRPRHEALYFQAGLINVARELFGKYADAALCCFDIDELLMSPDGQTAIDETKKSWLGYKAFQGYWRFAKAAKPAHKDHIFASKELSISKEKYCILPQGPLGFMPWDIHNVGRGRLNKLFISSKSWFYHCQQISTSWIINRNEPTVVDLTLDPQTEAAFKHAGH